MLLQRMCVGRQTGKVEEGRRGLRGCRWQEASRGCRVGGCGGGGGVGGGGGLVVMVVEKRGGGEGARGTGEGGTHRETE